MQPFFILQATDQEPQAQPSSCKKPYHAKETPLTWNHPSSPALPCAMHFRVRQPPCFCAQTSLGTLVPVIASSLLNYSSFLPLGTTEFISFSFFPPSHPLTFSETCLVPVVTSLWHPISIADSLPLLSESPSVCFLLLCCCFFTRPHPWSTPVACSSYSSRKECLSKSLFI